MMMKRLLIILASLVAAMPFSAGCMRKTAEVTYMSFNIRFITPKDEGVRSWESRRPAIVKMFGEVGPDVVGIQEQSAESVAWLQANLPDYEFYIPDHKEVITLPKGFSMVLFWKKDRFELVDCGRFFLSETPFTPSKGWDSNHYRNAAWIRLRDKISGKEFMCFNTHLDHRGPLAKEHGVLVTVEQIRCLAGRRLPVILGGDMNITRNGSQGSFLDPFYSYMKSARDMAPEADHADTFNGYSEDKSSHRLLDYIFCRNAKALEYEVVDSEDYGVRFISDHYPVMATFRF